MKKKLLVFTLAVLSVFTAFALRRALAYALKTAAARQADVTKTGSKRDGTYKLRSISKRAKVDGLPGYASVTIRLTGLLPTDLVNIHPAAEAEIKVVAGLMHREAADSSTSEDRLPESAVAVSASEVNFSRPETAEGDVILDIQLPKGASARVLADGSEVAAFTVQEPTAIRDGKVEPGAASLPAAVLQSAMPPGLAGAPPLKGEQAIGNGGAYFVPFEKLQVLKMSKVDLSNPRNRTTLEVSPEGEVVKVILVGGRQADPSLEEALKQWRFAPYLVDGRPVSVITVLPASQGK